MGLLDAVGSILGTNKTNQEIGAQQAAAGQADQTLQNQYNQQQQLNQPYYQAGTSALSQMQNPNFQQNFTLAQFQQDPGYQFQMQQGQQAIQRAAAAGGVGGGTLKDLQSYSQGLANNDYQQAFNNYQTQQNNQFGRLGTLAGMGQQAAGQDQASSMNYGNQVAQTQMGLGNAEAAAYGAEGNMNAGLINGTMGAAGQAGGFKTLFCDRRLKTSIEPVSREDLNELKGAITAFKFRYKNEKHGLGDFIGPMAQDIEKTKLGKGLVVEDQDGFKKIDVHRTLMLILASWGEI